MTAIDAPPRAGRREWIGLAVLALPTFVVAIDLFVLMLALPNLSTDLGADSNQQLWTMDIYGFVLAGFLITAGTLGDRIGHRKLLMIGVAAFIVASLLCAYSTSAGMLIGARALLGVAGAALGPCALGLIGNMFKDPKQQQKAFGLWAATFTLGALFGPVIGGALLAHFWWGSVFLLGVPFMVLALILGPKVLPETSNGQVGRLDPVSVGLSLVAMFPLIYGIKELARNGWQVLPVLSLVVGLVAGIAFVRRQNRLSDPLLDLGLFRNSTIGTSLAGQLAYSATGGAFMLFMMLYFQLVHGMTTLEAGLAMVPGMATGALGFNVGPKLASRIRPAYVIGAGLAVVALTLAFMSQVDPDSGSAVLIVAFSITAFFGAPMAGLGVGLAVGSAPPEKMGATGSLGQMANEFGSTLGIAILGTVGTAVYRSQVDGTIPAGVSADTAAAARDSLAGATAASGELPEQLRTALLTPAQEAFTHGLNVVGAIGAVLTGIAAILVAVRLRHLPPIGQAAPAVEESDDAPATAEVGAGGTA